MNNIHIRNDRRSIVVDYGLIILVILICYFPMWTGLLALKNDALTDNFPPKYFVSTALHAGIFPIWNPYINFGLPTYADPGFAFWHPLTWFFGAIGYSIHLLAIELQTYILIAAIGMYELIKVLRYKRETAIICGIMFGCCGFFVGSLQFINFITTAAFIPWLLLSFFKVHTRRGLSNIIICAVSGYLMITAGHPAIPIATAYFMGFIFICTLISPSSSTWIAFGKKSFVISTILVSLFFFILSSPYFLSLFEILPLISRSAPVEQKHSLDTGFTVPSYLSFIFPFAANAKESFFENESLIRNAYFSFAGFILFLTGIIRKHTLSSFQKITLWAGMFLLILSLGGYYKEFIYSNLPLLKYIRTNGEFRVFGILSFIMVAASPLDRLPDFTTSEKIGKWIITTLRFLSVITTLLLLFSSELNYSFNPDNKAPLVKQIKTIYDSLGFCASLLINCLLLITLSIICLFVYKKTPAKRLVSGLILTDLILFGWLLMPTGVQTQSAKRMQALIDEANFGIPSPQLTPIGTNTRPALNNVIGCWSYYSKQPGTPEFCDYPVYFTTTEQYFNSSKSRENLTKPFAYLSSNNGHYSISSFKATEFLISGETCQQDTLVILQNSYPGWVIKSDSKLSLQQSSYGFMEIPLEKGKFQIEFSFSRRQFWNKLWLCLIFLFFLLLYIILERLKLFSLSKQLK